MAEAFLKTYDTIFASRPPLASGKYTGYDYSDMTWAPYGPYWKLARKVYLNELFTPKRFDSLEYIRVEERLRFLASIYDYAQRGKAMVLTDHIKRYTLLSMSRMVLSDIYFRDHKPDKALYSISEFQEMVGELVVLNGVLNIGDWIPGLEAFDLQGYVKRMKAISVKFDAFHNHVIADHVEQKKLAAKNFVPKDMVDVLLQLTKDDANPETKLTIDSVKALVHDLMPGGTDTSSVTVEWAIHELLKNQRVLAKLREELDTVIGRDRWVEEKDASNLPYLNAIVKETLRLHPVSPLLAPHYALYDCKVAGYDIPKNTVVLINAWSIGRRPDCWDDPYDFRPERFLEGKEYGLNGQSFSLLPFGSGRSVQFLEIKQEHEEHSL